jgi:hypothetical protein
MKKKTHQVGVIRESDLRKRVRKALPPPPQKHKSAKDYSRKNSKKDLPEE